MKTNNLRGDVTDMLASKEPLYTTSTLQLPGTAGQRFAGMGVRPILQLCEFLTHSWCYCFYFIIFLGLGQELVLDCVFKSETPILIPKLSPLIRYNTCKTFFDDIQGMVVKMIGLVQLLYL